MGSARLAARHFTPCPAHHGNAASTIIPRCPFPSCSIERAGSIAAEAFAQPQDHMKRLEIMRVHRQSLDTVMLVVIA